MKKTAIIVAGGSGTRINSEVPKQFLELCALPIIMHTIKKFYVTIPQIEIIIVLPKSHFQLWQFLCKKHKFNIPHQIAEGGETRFHSVKNGLKLAKNESLIAIHDAVRPFVKSNVIKNCYDIAEKFGAAIPVVALKDSIRKISGSESLTQNRKDFLAVQTPQCFKSHIINQAYNTDYKPEFTDDASVVESSNFKIQLVDGNDENIKITTPLDLIIAEAILKNKND